jgi:hypothetical protein
MRKIHYIIWIAVIIVVLFSVTQQVYAATPQYKRVCHDVMVKSKKVQQCKNVRIHQKFKGTPIPAKPVKK